MTTRGPKNDPRSWQTYGPVNNLLGLCVASNLLLIHASLLSVLTRRLDCSWSVRTHLAQCCSGCFHIAMSNLKKCHNTCYVAPTGGGSATGLPADCHLCNSRLKKVFRLLRQRASLQDSRAHLPSGNPLQQDATGRLRGGCSEAGHCHSSGSPHW